MALKQFVLLAVAAAVIGLGINLVSPHSIPFVGDYRELSSGDGPIVPPSAEPGDPPFIAIDDAYLEYNEGKAIFVDARDDEEFKCGTIKGAISMPFEYLPDGDLAPYFDSVLAGAPKDARIITFCGGEECDLSLQLARNLQVVGYTNLAIFFGGAREWEDAKLPMDRRENCGE